MHDVSLDEGRGKDRIVIAAGSGVPVMMATLVVGAVIVAVAFVVRRVVLNTDEALPGQPSRPPSVADAAPSSPTEPERPDVTRERGSAAT